MSEATVWYILPSACIEQASKHLPVWRERGYSVAVLVRREEAASFSGLADLVLVRTEYYGYPWAIRELLQCQVIQQSNIIVAGGDDMLPDMLRSPAEIAGEFMERFPDNFGVMQPTGDGHGCDRICGSPWMGRQFVMRINQGRGPFWPEYNHFFADREMMLVASSLGILWQRPDLSQRHDHWSWTSGYRPDHMLNHSLLHSQDRDVFVRREANGFPGHEPL